MKDTQLNLPFGIDFLATCPKCNGVCVRQQVIAMSSPDGGFTVATYKCKTCKDKYVLVSGGRNLKKALKIK